MTDNQRFELGEEFASQINLYRDILPNRAFILSFRDLALVARRHALDDAVAYHASLTGEASAHERDLAVLGVVGEAMQVIEDVASFGGALMERIPGIPFYAPATVFDDRAINNFWNRMKKRDSDYILHLAGLRYEGKPLHDVILSEDQLQPSDIAALLEAEAATERMMREHLVLLAGVWENYRPFFHAFKHAAIVVNPDDAEIVDAGSILRDVFAVWKRRRDPAEIAPVIDRPTDWLVEEMKEYGESALALASHLVESRLAIFEFFILSAGGEIESFNRNVMPWRFWFRGADVSEEAKRLLRDRFGIVLVAAVDAEAA